MKNPVGYFEIPVNDLDRAISFYGKVFGYDFERVIIDGNEMAWFPNDPGAPGISGALAKGDSYIPTTEGTLVYFSTDNIDDTLSKANANGGKTLYPKHRSETWAGLPSLKIAKAIALPYIPSQYCLPSDPGRWIKSLGKRWCYAGSPTHGAA
jgi:predicted enzyme related to lactoylglutathione lyase